MNISPELRRVDPGYLLSLQYIRGVAALLVMLTHSGFYLNKIYGYDGIRLVFGDYFSYFGVIAFFILSGFLLTQLTESSSWRVFILHRIARIFPAYLIALTVTMAGYKLRAFAVPELDWRIFLLLPIGPDAFRPLQVEWTLVFEVSFYAVLSLFCLPYLRTAKTAFFLTWLALLVLLTVLGTIKGDSLPNASSIYLSGWNIAFIFGGLAYRLHKSQNNPRWTGFLGLVLVLCCTIDPRVTGILAPGGLALLFLHWITMEERKGTTFQSSVLKTLGSWSYAIYLTHVPVFLFLFPLLKNRGISPLSAWFCGVGFVLLAGAALGQIDVACYRVLKRKINQAFADRPVLSAMAARP